MHLESCPCPGPTVRRLLRTPTWPTLLLDLSGWIEMLFGKLTDVARDNFFPRRGQWQSVFCLNDCVEKFLPIFWCNDLRTTVCKWERARRRARCVGAWGGVNPFVCENKTRIRYIYICTCWTRTYENNTLLFKNETLEFDSCTRTYENNTSLFKNETLVFDCCTRIHTETHFCWKHTSVQK
jgi:hypothetical protein